MKRNRWIELYHSALLEMAESDFRSTELNAYILLARDAMEARRRELPKDNTHDLERRALEHALHNLQSALQELASNAPPGRA